MSNEVMTIQDVRCYLGANGTAYLDAEAVARGLGFTQTKGGVEYVRWETVNKYLNEFGYNSFSQLVGKGDFIPENMFYRLAMKANNAAAQKFQAKVADEILPSIRKHGVYMTPQAAEKILYNPDFIIGLAQQVKDAQAKIAILEPKADYCNKVLQSPEALNVTVIAKEYGMSGAMFNQLLYSLKIQYPSGKTWVLYQEYIGKGYTVTDTVITKNGGSVTQMKWTQKGREFLYYKLKAAGKVPARERQQAMAELL